MDLEHITFIGTLKGIEGSKKAMENLPDNLIVCKTGKCLLVVENNILVISIYPHQFEGIGEVNVPTDSKEITTNQDVIRFLYGDTRYCIGFKPRRDIYTAIIVEQEIKQKYSIKK